jgi:hypothetical protein
MNRMGIPKPDYTPDGVLAEITRVVPFFKGAVWEKLGDNGKQRPPDEAVDAGLGNALIFPRLSDRCRLFRSHPVNAPWNTSHEKQNARGLSHLARL